MNAFSNALSANSFSVSFHKDPALHHLIFADYFFTFSYCYVAGLYPWTSLISHCCVPNVKIITRYSTLFKSHLSHSCLLIFVIMTSGTTFPTSARPLSGFLRVMRWSPPIITIIITSLAPCTGEPLLHLVKVEKARCHSVKFSVFCPLK